jgi:ATPase subunit of ABC transporter with duplicated ATPase domains
MARQFIYHMQGLTKAYAGGKKVLENIHPQFYPDAKIGVLGPNGSGKSTLLRIMAGIDKEWNGEAWLAEGATVGYLPQEPQLDPARTSWATSWIGVAAKKAILDRYNELMMNYSDETAEKAGKLQDRSTPEPVGPRIPGRAGDGRAALPAGRCRRRQALGRREAPRGAASCC